MIVQLYKLIKSTTSETLVKMYKSAKTVFSVLPLLGSFSSKTLQAKTFFSQFLHDL